MSSLLIDNTLINDDQPPYVIAEIGHNHQGKLETALALIRAAADAGVSAVKFQKRDNRNLYTPEAFNRSYDSENSFGKTYGEHRENLEFGYDQYRICLEEAKKCQVSFFATAFDFNSADFLSQFDMPAYKIASGDLQNLPLLSYIASYNKPIIFSTGGGNLEMIDGAVRAIRKFHNNFAILQCTASYPAEFDTLNLRVIETLRKRYPENVIGFSGHDNGIAMSVVAYTLGARIIEKHFTLNRAMKGTDHAFSLEPVGMKKLVRDLNRARLGMGSPIKEPHLSEIEPIRKMGKMIVASRDLPANHKLKVGDLEFRSPAEGLPPSMLEFVVGKVLSTEVRQYSPILSEHFKPL